MEITNKRYGTPEYKYDRIYEWKTNGVIHDDFDALFQQYINTTHCNHCAKQFKDTRDRHLDHDHTTGLFRKIVCNGCNNNDRYIHYPNGYHIKEAKRRHYIKYCDKYKQNRAEYYENNKEQIVLKRRERYKNNKTAILASQAQKIECLCGSVVRRGDIADHKKTPKHMKLMDAYMNNID